MTIVIGALDKNNNIIFAGDRCASDGTLCVLDTPKIFKKDDMLFGIAGRCLLVQHLLYKFKIPKHPDNMRNKEFLYTLFIDELRKVFEENKVSEIDKNLEKNFSSIIIGYKDKIYKISSDFCICSFDSKFIAIGSGRELAMGVLEAYLHITGEIDKEALRKAIDVASKYNAYCDDNIDIIELSK